MTSRLKIVYVSICWAALAYSLYLTIVVPLAANYGGFLPKCSYLALTGEPCPLCGGSRLFDQFLHQGFARSIIFNPQFVLIMLVLAELIGRIAVLLSWKRIRRWKRLVIVDGICHGLALVYIVGYYVWFFKRA